MITIKIIGFKVGVKRPVYNKTIKIPDNINPAEMGYIGVILREAVMKSDFISIRRV